MYFALLVNKQWLLQHLQQQFIRDIAVSTVSQ